MTIHSSKEDCPPADLNRQEDAELRAREWLVLLNSEQVTAEDRQRFAQWLALDITHQTAYQHIDSIWQDASSLESLKAIEPRHLAKPSNMIWLKLKKYVSIDMPQVQWLTAMLLVVLVGSIWLSQPVQTPAKILSYQTGTAEKQRVELPDGSEVNLSPQTHIAVKYSSNERHITLHNGEAFFIVASNPQRPFIVTSRHTQVKVLGTLFNVNGNAFNTVVSVAEGKVQVASSAIPGYSDKEAKLTAGQQVNVSETKGMGRKQQIDASSADSWRRNIRIYDARPLEQVLRDLGRYHSAQLVITDKALGLQPVTAVFPTNNIDQMLVALESVLPVEVVEVNAERIEIRPR